MDIQVRDLGSLPGLADVIEEAAGSAGATATGAVAAAVDAADIPLHATMGVRDSIGSLIAWVRGRKLVRTLPEDIIPLTWFECHVPHHGTAQERFEATGTIEGGVAIKAFGSGLGRGHRVGLTLSSEASAPRTICADYVIDLRVLPHVYMYDGRESIVADVLRAVAQRTVERSDCPYCAITPDSIDQFENILEPAIDLRADRVGRKIAVKLDWSADSSVNVGIELPRAGVAVALNARIARSGSLSVSYELAPTYLYQKYRPIDTPGSAPRWAFSA
jgi:hypothetical protein